MLINYDLNVNCHEFFSILENSIYEDIKSSDKSINLKDLKKGFTYTKNLKNSLKQEGTVKVTIEEYEKNSIYKSSFTSSKGVNTIKYQLEKKDDKCNLIYEEEFFSSKTSLNLNYKLMNFLMKRRNKKKINTLIRSMESYIISNRTA